MTAVLPALTLLAILALPVAAADFIAAAPDSGAAAPDAAVADSGAMKPVTPSRSVTAPSRPDSAPAPPRLVRTFPPIEVRALIHDLGSSQVVHLVSGEAVRSLPVDNLAELVALQPGVVVEAEELHVRGGRAGETAVSLEGLGLNEPFRRCPMEVPLLAIERAELVSGAPDAPYGGGLAGVLDLHTVHPGERPAVEWRWQSDGGSSTRFDRLGARAGTPLPLAGIGIVAAVDATFDDTSLPRLRSALRHDVVGAGLGWRADNRMLGFLKLAPTWGLERFSLQLLAGRSVRQPYDPQWSLDGWTFLSGNLKDSPVFSPVALPGYLRYRAADHLAMTDDRQLAALARVSILRPRARASVGLGWMRTGTVTSVGGGREPASAAHRPLYGKTVDRDRFYVLWGDYPLYRESDSDVITLRGDGEIQTRGGGRLSAGLGLTHEHVSMREMDWFSNVGRSADPEGAAPLDSIREYRAAAPGGFAYFQSRWLSGGLILNAGLRAEYYTPGPEAARQTLPGSDDGVWSFGPRLGLAYPLSVRDAFSFAYVRIQQAPGRDYLYDRRTAISDRQPLGNPALVPATVVSYEAAVKHLFGPTWALQASVFYRDVFGQIGELDYRIPGGTMNLRYQNADQSQVAGFEWSLIHGAPGRRIEAHFTWMSATGNESRPEGDPYGPVRAASALPIGDQALSWDRRHSLFVSGSWVGRHHTRVSWSTAVGSPLPWTPKPRRQPFTDLGIVNTRRLGWTETTNLDAEWTPPRARGLAFGVNVRNLFDNRAERAATLDGYPNPVVNTLYDDYGAYRTETGEGGGAYWSQLGADPGHWVPVHDPRLSSPPRTVRASIGARW